MDHEALVRRAQMCCDGAGRLYACTCGDHLRAHAAGHRRMQDTSDPRWNVRYHTVIHQEPLEYLESGVSLEAQCASWVAALLPLRDRVHTCVLLKFRRKTTGQATRKPAVKDSLKPAWVQGSAGASHYELRGNRASALRRRPASFADTGAGEPLL